MTDILKKCTGCGLDMASETIIKDPTIRPIGMSFMDIDSDSAYYFFQHEVENCGSCFVINVNKFTALINETFPENTLYRTDRCNKYCTDIQSLESCCNECHFSPYRRFLLYMLKTKFPEKMPG